MAFKFKAVPKRNPQDPDAPPRFYASPVYSGDVNIRQLAEIIAEISTVSSIDTLAVLEAFLQVIPKELSKGNIVRLRDFGTFRLGIHSEGSDTAEEVTSHNIKGMKSLFRPDKLILSVS